MYKTNKELAKIFNDMAAIYRFHGSADRFRVIAYQNAARVIDHLTEDIQDFMKDDELEEIKGIGEGIAAKIREYVKTGKIKKYEELKKEVPHDLVELLKIPGMGPETLKRFHQELGVNTREDLLEALDSKKIQELKGFGEKTVENLRQGLKQASKSSQRMLLAEALEIVEELGEKLSGCKEIQKLEFAGSVRRMKETIGDVDILATAKKADGEKVLDYFTSMPGIKKVLARGGTKASVVIEQKNRQVDMRLVNDSQWGAALLYFTGSKDHNIHLRTIAKDRGYKINEYGLYDNKSNKKVTGGTEEGMYKQLGLQWIPPEMRENEGEIELAARGNIPKLIEGKDIKGDFHLHSDWSDGLNAIEELASHVKEHYPYEYLVLTDHSKTSVIAGGLTEDEVLKQLKEIERVNDQLGSKFLKAGIELDILPDGSLDFEDELLARLDWVTASIHSRFNVDNTDRILKACENPYVNAISHPTGRLIGKRKEYPVDLKRVIQKAIKTGTALEINAQPQRMDLNDNWARMARQEGAMLLIGTDSHDLMSFEYMKLGVSVARRAWCTSKNILNTRNWKEVLEFRDRKRKAKKLVGIR
ncbi:MAG TPA: DNA polymerase/3'-5' exonuclease PolX [Balneolaceae bacterium]|nr:DNA polymerase/3'-5' exonuclease PolX [Balneolaceae bacterium]